MEWSILAEGITIVFFHLSLCEILLAEKNRPQDRGINLTSSTLSSIWGCAAGWHGPSDCIPWTCFPKEDQNLQFPYRKVSASLQGISVILKTLKHSEQWDGQNPNTRFCLSDTKKHSRVGQWLCLSQDEGPLTHIFPFTNGVANICSVKVFMLAVKIGHEVN